jgi:hypothetical protein
VTDFGFSDLNKLSADLTALPVILTNEVTFSMQQVGEETKKAWRKDAAKGVLHRQYSGSIDYTQREFGAFGQGVLELEIGPNLARYGGKTGKGGLVPSFGIFDDPIKSGIRATPTRARQKAEKFAADELLKRLEIAVDESAKKVGL